MISILDLTLNTPAENLALDEALLDECDTGSGEESLRFWQPRETFVVVGYANSVEVEVNLVACEAAGVPVFRRCTGGGTVVQMPGVLNYNLVLKIPETGPLSTLTGTNRWVMSRLRDALAPLPGWGDRLTVRGISDLCLDNRKVMGSAQRRKRTALVFHGSLLLDADLQRLEQLLRFPSKQPAYRADRSHSEFCTNLNEEPGLLKQRIAEAWGPTQKLLEIPRERLAHLVEQRYAREEWNRRL